LVLPRLVLPLLGKTKRRRRKGEKVKIGEGVWVARRTMGKRRGRGRDRD
jgi:hypothetical protein